MNRGHLPNCRPAIERMAYIAEMLRTRQPFNCTTIAEHFEVSTKTIMRDMEFIQYRLDFDIEYVGREHTFRLVKAPESTAAFLFLAAPVQSSRRRAAQWMEAA